MNKVFLIGNLTTDVDKRTTESGVAYARFGLAVGRRPVNKNSQNNTDFFNVICWRNQADFAGNYLSKGKKVSIVGSIQINKYQGQDGTNKTSVDIVVEDMEILTPRDSQGNEVTGNANTNNVVKEKKELTEETTDGDLPF
jgi:single-strand DNA-binding protein